MLSQHQDVVVLLAHAGVEQTPLHPRAERAERGPLGVHVHLSHLDDRLGQHVVLHTQGLQIWHQGVRVELWCLRIHSRCGDLEVDGRTASQGEQDVEDGEGVLAARETNKQPITLLHHFKVGNGFSDHTTEGLRDAWSKLVRCEFRACCCCCGPVCRLVFLVLLWLHPIQGLPGFVVAFGGLLIPALARLSPQAGIEDGVFGASQTVVGEDLAG
mmetsp:Transcript_40577/g.87096  ORF Transcript_40577/g.87096 Transcript_40577/m.87096 type:complete len:214 (+) Transcript_40577:850-1491(+)